uniref:CAF1B/HIR1 beta-propeller domain-containing protein n=1 Tax=Chromera velia CCMP2878 TaxID=1169474 RepID=A0A0G4HZV9_9ALVE|eukprot:Cvel_9816.t1-p1 / transcript=Cvel_9816.t1 / gene=Cvel_9816 / organism=Chromera_velia_CCMP2878 / gene_product=Chromatin assembly factor 1 subunit B, putative / transcript_product=Chromatin assembly factor 1 subunit B, putative / location=Cvel_scaffold576:28705-36127(+) / protein_length=898 / sequence_SO=supercontig / SO=protein_coding / is_pseudo=false
MRVLTPEILYHGEKLPERINSVDIQPGGNRLVTAGADPDIHVWRLQTEGVPEKGKEKAPAAPAGPHGSLQQAPVRIIAKLKGHQKEVNCVRFCPAGYLLASGSGDECVIIWKLSEKKGPALPSFGDDPGETFEEQWTRLKTLRNLSAVLSVAWAPDGETLAVGVEDDEVILWDVTMARCIRKLSGHTHFVMGVAWDPQDQILISQSSDKSMRVWSRRPTQSEKAQKKKKVPQPQPEAPASNATAAVQPEPRLEDKENENVQENENQAEKAAEGEAKEGAGCEKGSENGKETNPAAAAASSSTSTAVPAPQQPVQQQPKEPRAPPVPPKEKGAFSLTYNVKHFEKEKEKLKDKDLSAFTGEGGEDDLLGEGLCPLGEPLPGQGSTRGGNMKKENNKGQARKSIFLSDTQCPSFVRRPDWSPDGTVLVVPSGCFQVDVSLQRSPGASSQGGAPAVSGGKKGAPAAFMPSAASGEPVAAAAAAASASTDDNGRPKGREKETSVLAPVSFMFHRRKLASPLMAIPSLDAPTIAVRFCPVTFSTLSPHGGKGTEGSSSLSAEKTKSRSSMIFPRSEWQQHASAETAAASPTDGVTSGEGREGDGSGLEENQDGMETENKSTGSSQPIVDPPRFVYATMSLGGWLYIHDTQRALPLGVCRDIHFQGLTDATWSSDGQLLVVASSDGYLSFVRFAEGELGAVKKPAAVYELQKQRDAKQLRAAEERLKQRTRDGATWAAEKERQERAKAAAAAAEEKEKDKENPEQGAGGKKKKRVAPLMIDPAPERPGESAAPSPDVSRTSSSRKRSQPPGEDAEGPTVLCLQRGDITGPEMEDKEKENISQTSAEGPEGAESGEKSLPPAQPQQQPEPMPRRDSAGKRKRVVAPVYTTSEHPASAEPLAEGPN